jgi:hypothetical protein
MRVALGLKAHSGWAALVVIGGADGALEVVERRRLELVEAEDADWAKQPYHAAEHLPPAEAKKVVERGIRSARLLAVRELETIVQWASESDHKIVGCAVLMGEPMPEWSVAEILAVHFRMHKAEGVLFRDVLARAAEELGLKLFAIREKQLVEQAELRLGVRRAALSQQIVSLGKKAGPPWGQDQKYAALAAMIALRSA